jgi:hypothetical protein
MQALEKIQTAYIRWAIGLLDRIRGRYWDKEPKFILEVGLSETYEQLVQDAKLWLEGTRNVSVVVLVKFTENPKYRCPIPNATVKHLDRLNIPRKPSEVRDEDFDLEGEYGPVTYKGLKWMGEIAEAFLEVWKRNPAMAARQPRN